MSFRAIRMEDHTSYVSLHDEAIDWEGLAETELAANEALSLRQDLSADQKRAAAKGEVMDRYAQAALKDPGKASELLRFKSGLAPARFVIGAIPPDELVRLNDECKLGSNSPALQQLAWRAFIAALRRIEGWDACPAEKIPTRTTGVLKRVDPEWIAGTFIRGLNAVALEVGRVAYHWNRLSEDEAKN